MGLFFAVVASIVMVVAFIPYAIGISLNSDSDEELMRIKWEHYFVSYLPAIFFINTRWRVNMMQKEVELATYLNEENRCSEGPEVFYDLTIEALKRNRPELFDNANYSGS